MTSDLQSWREARRAEQLAARCAVPMPARRGWDEAITARLESQFAALQGWVVGGYWPFRSEFDPRFWLRHLRRRGSRTALPVVVGKGMPLQFREWWPGAAMVRATLGLPMPQGTALVAPQALLMPPVGFDEQGYRLGYGGGYFDRTLAAMQPQPLKIGVAYELSRMATIRPQWHDIAMDFIVTEQALYQAGGQRLVRLDDTWRWR